MPLWLQHTLVLTLVAVCLVYALWQGLRSLFGKQARLGNCCTKGCPSTSTQSAATSQRIVFLPSDALRKRR
jgi:hypothetical protein